MSNVFLSHFHYARSLSNCNWRSFLFRWVAAGGGGARANGPFCKPLWLKLSTKKVVRALAFSFLPLKVSTLNAPESRTTTDFENLVSLFFCDCQRFYHSKLCPFYKVSAPPIHFRHEVCVLHSVRKVSLLSVRVIMTQIDFKSFSHKRAQITSINPSLKRKQETEYIDSPDLE